MRINSRERAVLQPAIVHRSKIEVNRNGIAYWDGDLTARIRAVASIKSLLEKKLLERECAPPGWEIYRATAAGKSFRCRASGCHRGRLYEEDTEIGKCANCAGTGVVLDSAMGAGGGK